MQFSYKRFLILAVSLCLVVWWFSLPRVLFKSPLSVVAFDQEDQLLGARIAQDGQWRFPEIDAVPEKFETALLRFEDNRFYNHWGIDIRSMARALVQNLKARHVVSGASTLSMQVIRLSNPKRGRTIANKLSEIFLALRLECTYSKQEILKLYASHAPMGGNVVGLEAASWRYYGKNPALLTWAEAATLAVLPNSPALIHPGRSREKLLFKRNRLLARLYNEQKLSESDYKLALLEPLPLKPLALPNLSPHLLVRLADHPSSARHQTTISSSLQAMINNRMAVYGEQLKGNGIHNGGAVVIDLEDLSVKAYVGNIPGTGREHAEFVDVVNAPRSTGSILKPLLYALALDDGIILPKTWLEDVPLQINGYHPENYHRTYSGLVGAHTAISRSLNVPMVRLLQNFGVDRFLDYLRRMGFTSFSRSAEDYGLSLILGGGEASLWELCSVYAVCAKTLRSFGPNSGKYPQEGFGQPYYSSKEKPARTVNWTDQSPIISAAAIWHMTEAMQKVERPSQSGQWEAFASGHPIAWKTGTSFGFRDAWAIGFNHRYLVGIWVGNADGEGRPGLVGVKAAAPLLFEIFRSLPSAPGFEAPYDELAALRVCTISGHRAGSYCPADTSLIIDAPAVNLPCPYHKQIYLDATGTWRVHRNCKEELGMKSDTLLDIPPLQAHYLQKDYAGFDNIPPYHPDCLSQGEQPSIAFIYPRNEMDLYLPVNLNGETNPAIFEVTHHRDNALLHWHLDEQYLGTTSHQHQMSVLPDEGPHKITVIDERGNRLSQRFLVLEREKKSPTFGGN